MEEEGGGGLLSDPTLLLQHVKEMKQERDKANSKYEQVGVVCECGGVVYDVKLLMHNHALW